MASARCAYCNATLTPNSAYCLECGQLIPQSGAAAPVVQAPAFSPTAAAGEGAPAPASNERIPLPRSLPWQSTRGGEPDQAPAPVAAPQRVDSVELLLPTGERLRVTGQVVLGRQPADTAHAMGARSIPIADTTRSVSRVHMFLNVADGTVTVADAGSANGSRLQRGQTVYQLEGGGAPAAAAPGDTVWLGDVSVAIRA